MDLDDTFLPFGQIITETELDGLIAYLDAGGMLTFNTLATKEWFYRRVIDRLVTPAPARIVLTCSANFIGLFQVVARSSCTTLPATATAESITPRHQPRPQDCYI